MKGIVLLPMSMGNGNGGKKAEDWCCRICVDDCIAKAKANGRMPVRPNQNKGLLLVYVKSNVCSRGHTKGEAHLCAWSDAHTKIKERQPTPTPAGVSPKTKNTEGVTVKKLQEDISELKKQVEGKGNEKNEKD